MWGETEILLERLCNKLAADNFLPEHGETLRKIALEIEQAYKENRFDGMIEANSKFHESISNISQNDYLKEMLKQVRSRYYICNTFAWSYPDVVNKILPEHNQFIEALESKNYEQLDYLSESHIKYSKDLYINHLQRRKG